MEQKRVSAQPTRSLSFHLPLSVTGISSFEALLELLGIPSLELLYLSWKDQLFPGFTSFDEAENTITPLWIISILFHFHRYSQKIEKMSHFVLTLLSNLKKNQILWASQYLNFKEEWWWHNFFASFVISFIISDKEKI